MLGASEGELDEPLMRQAAELCRAAGADEALIPGWIEEGRRRRTDAARAPFGAPRRIRPGQHPPGRGGLASIPGDEIHLRSVLLADSAYARDLGRCQQLSVGPLADLNQADMLARPDPARNPQVTRIASPSLSSFGPGIPACGVQEDPL